MAALSLFFSAVGSAQACPPSPRYPEKLPYRFSNFVWWSDVELRSLIKRRVPALGDELATTPEAEDRVREALVALLKEKGIAAEVQSNEPSNFALTAERAPGAPEPAIAFSILSPQVLIDEVVLSDAPESLKASLQENLQRRAGHEYSSSQDWMVRSDCADELNSRGYLEARIVVSHGAPRRDGDHYLVNLLVSIEAGPQYHISAITADGGPLRKGGGLSQYFAAKPGDVAVPNPFGRLAGDLRSVYWHYGYAAVEIHGPPVLDRQHALVSYHLEVVPGPIYHLNTLTIHKLDSVQEGKARELLGMKPGDVFDELAINGLYQRIRTEPTLAAYSFTFNPAKDPAAAKVDLTLDFYKTSDASSVTIK
jgi:hypothetical protein